MFQLKRNIQQMRHLFLLEAPKLKSYFKRTNSLIKSNNINDSPHINTKLSKHSSHLFISPKGKQSHISYPSLNHPRHKIYFFDNKEKLEKLQRRRTKLNPLQSDNNKDKPSQLNISSEDYVNTLCLLNPFQIKNYPSQRSTSFTTKMKSQSISCNMNKTLYRSNNKAQINFNGYATNKNPYLNESEQFMNSLYSKPKLNIEEILLNHHTNKPNHLRKTQLKTYQLKQSMLLTGRKHEKTDCNQSNNLFTNMFNIKRYCK